LPSLPHFLWRAVRIAPMLLTGSAVIRRECLEK
jgi:hypothetical protein